jgi:acyl-CoA hydrolase
MSRDTVQADWRSRLTSAAEAVSVVRPGDHVFVGSACATPRSLVDALEQLTTPPPGVVLVHFLTDHVARGVPSTNYRHRVFYVGRDVLALAASEQIDYVPISLPDVPALFGNGRIPLDVALVQVAPPDEDGTCSLGISVDITRAAALAARTVIAEVNPAMPRTRGETRIPVERIDRFVAVDSPIVEYLHEPADDCGRADRALRRTTDRRSVEVTTESGITEVTMIFSP